MNESTCLAPLFERLADPAERARYTDARPFAHAVFDDVLPTGILNTVAVEARALERYAGKWTRYEHLTERRKRGCTDLLAFGPTLRMLVRALNSSACLQALAAFAGTPRLVADWSLEGGGVHVMARNGFLDRHADFRAHPVHRRWSRQLNVLLYLTPDWRSDWGGDLELAPPDQACTKAIEPVFGRLVLFTTTRESFHGVVPVRCPDGIARRSLALYFYHEEQATVPVRATHYLDRPDAGLLRRARLRAERVALYAYTLAKRYAWRRDAA